MEGIKGQYTTTASARSRPKSKIKGTRNGWHIKRIASLAIESEGPRDGLSRRTSGTSIESLARRVVPIATVRDFRAKIADVSQIRIE